MEGFCCTKEEKIGVENFIFFSFHFFSRCLGELLQLNFENTYKHNKMALMKDAKAFGVDSQNKAHASLEYDCTLWGGASGCDLHL